MQQQGVEQQHESIGSIGLFKNRTSFSTFFSTIFDLKNESQIQPELGDSQQVTAKLGVNSKKTTDDPDKSRTTGGE